MHLRDSLRKLLDQWRFMCEFHTPPCIAIKNARESWVQGFRFTWFPIIEHHHTWCQKMRWHIHAPIHKPYFDTVTICEWGLSILPGFILILITTRENISLRKWNCSHSIFFVSYNRIHVNKGSRLIAINSRTRRNIIAIHKLRLSRWLVHCNSNKWCVHGTPTSPIAISKHKV